MIRTLKLAPALALFALAGAQSLAQPSKPLSQIVTLDPQTSGTVSSTWSISSSENGRTIKLEGRDGVISAEIDGKAVPADRIVREGSIVKIKDDKGEVIYQTETPGMDSGTITHGFSSKSQSPFWSFSPRGAAGGMLGRPGAGSPFGTVAVDVDPPKVMIGVQLLDPDSTLRGHLGLKENEATLVGAIYEGLPAAKAGIEPYDIIVAIDGKTPAGPMDVRKALRAVEAGKSISLDVIHRGQKKAVLITVDKYDPERLDKSKMNAIAAVTNTPNASTIAGAYPLDWPSSGNSSIVGIPKNGQPLAFINPGTAGVDSQALAEQVREIVAKAQAEADAARRMAPSINGNLQAQMSEMMKRMDAMQRMLEQQREKSKAEEKNEGRS